MNRMSAVAGVACACNLLACTVWSPGVLVRAAAGEAGTKGSVTVVAELFTSEGCSSCPPADDVLTRLVSSQPVPGVEIVALGEHVDYWDRLGWRDPFSSASFTSRQSQYGARVFRTDNIYTPQIVIDGQFEGNGSDFNAIRKAVLEAAQSPKAALTLAARRDGDRLSVDVQVDVPPDLVRQKTADVTLAVTEDHLVTHVRRGENGGRTLTHSAVVRSFTTVGELLPQSRTFSTTASTTLAPDWKRENLRIVVFVQERQSRRILGAGSFAEAR